MNFADQTPVYSDRIHPTPEALRGFALGELNEEASEVIEQHLSNCLSCRELLHTGAEDSLVVLIRAAAATSVNSDRGTPLSTGRSPRSLPGYELLEVLGEGGMGVVWKARQVKLNRLIALKLLRSAGAASAEALARFRREAEAVAHLQHPHIVQIHEIGEQEGEPFLALEYVSGGSLAQKLAAGPLAPRQAAALVETLARAMQNAHEHGIIHRDLKPANVLLAEDGSPKISDFGLAKQLDEATAQTQSGAILGTPSYMAPEQAGGLQGSIGPLTDVYALGALLYETLTGQPPFRGPTVLETLAQVREREPVLPRQLQPNIPRDLETVCLKCLYKEPQKRYSRAADLADDLRRFLDGQPIRARRASLVERLVKWARRKPAWAALGIVSVLGLAALLGGGLWYQAQLRAAVQRADANRKQAVDNYRHARQAINQMLNILAKFQAPGVPQIEVLRRNLSKEALTFFQDIAQAEADADPETRFDIAKAYLLLEGILGGQGQLEAARESVDHARLLLEGLCAEDPANLDYRIQLSKCLERLAVRAGAQGCTEEDLHLREQNLEFCQELCRLAPDNIECQRALGLAHLNLGVSHDTGGRREQAELHFKEAAHMLEKVVREQPESADDQYRLVVSYSNLALMYRDSGRIDEADAAYREVEPRLAELVRQNPEKKHWTGGLVQTLRNWGGMLVTARRGEEAGPLLNRAVALMDKWRLEDPQDPGVPQLLLACLTLRMYNDTLLHRRDEGKKDWQRALALSAQLKSWSELCEHVWMDAHLGDHSLAAERAAYLAKQKELEAVDLAHLGIAYALAASVARKDSRLAPAERERKAKGYVVEAVRLLERAGSALPNCPSDVLHNCACVLAWSGNAEKAMPLLSKLRSDGYFDKAENLTKLHTDHDLDPLRRRDDFAELLNNLARPTRRK